MDHRQLESLEAGVRHTRFCLNAQCLGFRTSAARRCSLARPADSRYACRHSLFRFVSDGSHNARTSVWQSDRRWFAEPRPAGSATTLDQVKLIRVAYLNRRSFLSATLGTRGPSPAATRRL